jgi:hypothetical protein
VFVCGHIVLSHVVAMTKHLLSFPPVQNTSLMGRTPDPQSITKNIKTNENKNHEQKDNTI